MLSIVLIFTFIRVTFLVLKSSPQAFTISYTFTKVSLKKCSVGPCIFTISFRLAFIVISNIDISVSKYLLALSVFHKVFKLSLISVTRFPTMHSKSICFAFFPLSFIKVSFISRPLPLYYFSITLSLFDAMIPFTIINFSIWPHKFAFSMRFSI